MSIAGVNESDGAKSVADISNESVVACAKESVVPDPAMLVGIVDESVVAISGAIPNDSVVASANESVVPDPAMLVGMVNESVVASEKESVVPDPAMLVAIVDESVNVSGVASSGPSHVGCYSRRVCWCDVSDYSSRVGFGWCKRVG